MIVRKLNGWQRLGIVTFLLWAVSAYIYVREADGGPISDDWPSLITCIFGPPIIISLLWCLSYGSIKVFYWIMAGFSKTDRSATALKKSFPLTAGVTLALILLITFSNVHEANKEKAFNMNAAQCELDAIKSKIDFNDLASRDEYITTCLKTRGYSFQPPGYLASSCDGYYTPSYLCFK